VFSFGVTIWEMLTRQTPYGGMGNLEAAVKVANDETFRLKCPVNTPDALMDLMRECWMHNPDDRPDFRSVVNRLDSFHKQLLISSVSTVVPVTPLMIAEEAKKMVTSEEANLVKVGLEADKARPRGR